MPCISIEVPRAGRLADLECGGDLEPAADDRPAGHDQHQHQRGGPGPGQGEHPGGEVDQPDEQVPDDRPRVTAAERPHDLQTAGDERVHREQHDEGKHRDAWPGQRHDPDGDREEPADQQ